MPMCIKDDQWALRSLSIELDMFDDKGEGTYKGKIQFQNGRFEFFSFQLKPEMVDRALELVIDELAKSSEELIQQLRERLLTPRQLQAKSRVEEEEDPDAPELLDMRDCGDK